MDGWNNELPRRPASGISASLQQAAGSQNECAIFFIAAPQAGSLLRSDKLRGIKPYSFRIVLQMIRVIRVICEICGLKEERCEFYLKAILNFSATCKRFLSQLGSRGLAKIT